MKLCVFVCVAVLALAGCSQTSLSAEPWPEATEQVAPPSLPATEPELETNTGLFAVRMEVPEQAKANEMFEMKADLQKLSDDEVRMMHAGGVFYFTIRDSGGKQVNTFAMVDVGISRA